jgi:hypothetical protein
MAEPYEELDPRLRLRAIVVFRNWARVQRVKWRPFLEVIDGTTITPLDLLVEVPPIPAAERHEYKREVPFLRLLRASRSLLRRQKPNAWRHVLNLVAVSVEYGEESIDDLLAELGPRWEDAGGSVDGMVEA